jgi:hypothetical protein
MIKHIYIVLQCPRFDLRPADCTDRMLCGCLQSFHINSWIARQYRPRPLPVTFLPNLPYHSLLNITFFFFCRDSPQWATSSFTMFLDHTQQRTTVGRIPLDEWSACRRDLYLATHNPRNRQTSMPSVRFEPTISAGERPKTYALNRGATGTGRHNLA